MESYALAALAVVLVTLALPHDGIPWRLAGAAAVVVAARAWPVRTSLLTASAEEAARNVAFLRAFVAGALLAEAAYVAWRSARDRAVPLR